MKEHKASSGNQLIDIFTSHIGQIHKHSKALRTLVDSNEFRKYIEDDAFVYDLYKDVIDHIIGITECMGVTIDDVELLMNKTLGVEKPLTIKKEKRKKK
jgi:hypothetical protein